MQKLKRTLEMWLREAGINVKEGGQWQMGKLVKDRDAYLRLGQIIAQPGAMQQYLGMDQEGNEILGMELKVQFALVLLSPKAQGAEMAEVFGEEVLETLLPAAGQMAVGEILCGEAGYDSVRDCFRQEIGVQCRVMAYGTRGEDGITLRDFRVRAAIA